MKLIQFAVCASIILNVFPKSESHIKPGLASVPQKNNTVCSCNNRQPQRTISEQEILTAITKLESEPYSIQKLSTLRQLVIRGRRTTVSQSIQEKISALLHDAHKNHNKEDRREFMILNGLLNMVQTTPLISNIHKEELKKLATDISSDSTICNGNTKSNVATSVCDLSKIQAKDDYQSKIYNFSHVIRRTRFLGYRKDMQSEISSAIHDLYSHRPTDNVNMLAKLQSVLQQVQASPVLSTINQYEVREIMLPAVTREIERIQATTTQHA